MAYNAPIIYNIKNSLCCAGEDVWYLEANGDVHPCLGYQLEAGKRALHNGIFKKETINVNSKEIEDIKKSGYWATFNRAKHNFETKKIPTCKECSFMRECQPCFMDYGLYNRPILECEWTKKRELALYNSIKDTVVHINENVSYDNKNRVISNAGEPILILNNDISEEIWQQIEKIKKPNLLLETLLDEYDVDRNILQFDITAFLYTLQGKGIIDFRREE